MKKSIITGIICLVFAVSMLFSSTVFAAESTDVTEEQLSLMDSQMIGLTGVSNARQLGGYKTEDGRTVKDGVLIRSGKLSTATEDDIAILSDNYNIKLIIDLRSASDISRYPDPDVNNAESVNIPVWDETLNGISLADFMTLQQEFGSEPGRSDLESIRRGWMGTDEELYFKQTFLNDISLQGFRQFIDVLLTAEEDTGIIYHCSSGKDRTGSASVIILTLLGVDRDTIIADFGLTNAVLKDSLDAKVSQSANYTDDEEELYLVFTMNGVNPSYMEKMFDMAEEECGSMLEYIKQIFNVTDEEIEILRDKFLE